MKISQRFPIVLFALISLVGCKSQEEEPKKEVISKEEAQIEYPRHEVVKKERAQQEQPGNEVASKAEPGYEVISKKKAQEVLADEPGVLLLDVRTSEEFAAGHIEGARNINFFDTDFREQLDDLDKDGEVYIYCRSGNRSEKAGKIMLELGFEKVYDIEGGYSKWK